MLSHISTNRFLGKKGKDIWTNSDMEFFIKTDLFQILPCGYSVLVFKQNFNWYLIWTQAAFIELTINIFKF